MQATTKASLQPGARTGPARERSDPPTSLIVVVLGFCLAGLVVWAVAQSRSVSAPDAVERSTSPVEGSSAGAEESTSGDLSEVWTWIGAGFVLLLTLAWTAGLVALALWLVPLVL